MFQLSKGFPHKYYECISGISHSSYKYSLELSVQCINHEFLHYTISSNPQLVHLSDSDYFN